MNEDTKITPIYDRKTGAVCLPYKKKLMEVYKDNNKFETQFLCMLPRNRMRLRIPKGEVWKTGDTIQIHGTNAKYTCVVKSFLNQKVVVKKVS